MNIKSQKKTLTTTLNELSLQYLESLSTLVDLPILDSKDQIMDSLLSNLKNPIKIKNYFHNLSDFQKMVISDVIYNLDGNYIESYVLAKYDKVPLFERKSILFTNNQSPNYLSLFIYKKSYIPLDLQRILKKFTPKPTIWEPENYEEEITLNTTKNTYSLSFYSYLYSQLNILKTNKKKFKLLEESENLLKDIINTKATPTILKLLFYSNSIIVRNRKILPNYSDKVNLTDLVTDLLYVLINDKEFLYSIYKKKNLEYIKNIIKFRNIIISSIFQIKEDTAFKLKEIYKFIEINNYNKAINITKAEKLKDLKIFIKDLSHLGVINFYDDENSEIISINKDQIDFLSKDEYIIKSNIEKEILVLENFEIIILEKLSRKNEIFLNTFTIKESNKKYQIDKNKLLKLLNKGLTLSLFVYFLKEISNNDLPNSLDSYFKDLEFQKISIDIKNETLSANTLLIETLLHSRKFKLHLEKIEESKISYNKDIEKKLISYLTSLEYYIEKINNI